MASLSAAAGRLRFKNEKVGLGLYGDGGSAGGGEEGGDDVSGGSEDSTFWWNDGLGLEGAVEEEGMASGVMEEGRTVLGTSSWIRAGRASEIIRPVPSMRILLRGTSSLSLRGWV